MAIPATQGTRNMNRNHPNETWEQAWNRHAEADAHTLTHGDNLWWERTPTEYVPVTIVTAHTQRWWHRIPRYTIALPTGTQHTVRGDELYYRSIIGEPLDVTRTHTEKPSP